jgi:hypothetical protein
MWMIQGRFIKLREEGMKNKALKIFLWILPLVLAILSFLPTLSLGFDSESANLYVYPFTFGHLPVNPFFFFLGNLKIHGDELPYRPLYYFNFTLDYLLFDASAFWYRLENLVMFLLILCGMMRLAKLFAMNEWGVLATGLFLVLHPSRVFMMLIVFVEQTLGMLC